MTDSEIQMVKTRLTASPNTLVDPDVVTRLTRDLIQARETLRRIAEFPPSCLEAHVLQVAARETLKEAQPDMPAPKLPGKKVRTGRKVYLACPYSDPDPAVREKRFKTINGIAARLIREGHIVFSPISMTHPIASAHDMPQTWEFWEAQDIAYLEWCDMLVVAMLDGWTESVGIQGEMKRAAEYNKPVMFIGEHEPLVALRRDKQKQETATI